MLVYLREEHGFQCFSLHNLFRHFCFSPVKRVSLELGKIKFGFLSRFRTENKNLWNTFGGSVGLIFFRFKTLGGGFKYGLFAMLLGEFDPQFEFCIWMFPKIVVPPNHPLKNRVYHYKPSILGYP